MKSFSCYTSRTDHVLSKQLQLLWRYAMVMALILVSTAGALSQGGKTPPDPGVPNNVSGIPLEVDADFAQNNTPSWWSTIYGYDGTIKPILSQGIDWSSLTPMRASTNNGATVWATDGNSGNKAPAGYVETDIFGGTSNKNGDPIGINQSPYTVVNKAAGPQKNDVTNVYFHKEVINGRTWLFFGAETRSTDGTSYLDFEYNQAGVVIENGLMYGPKESGASTINGRTIGDFIIVVNFSGGGKQPSVGVRTWEPGGVWSSETLGNLGTTAFLVTNVQSVPHIKSDGGFNGDGSFSSTSSAFQFVEGAFDITDVLPTTTCSPFATMTTKTRSSDSFTAELKDLFIVDYPLNPSPTVTVAGGEACLGKTLTFTATPSGGTPSYSYQWYKGSIASGNEVGSDSPTYSKTAEAGDDGVSYYVVVTDANNCTGQNSKAAVVNSLPSVTVSGGEACVGATLTFTATPSGGTPSYSYQWYKGSIASGNEVGSDSPTYSKTAEAGDDGISYYVVVTDIKGCQGQNSKAAKITANPSPPTVMYHAPACDEDKFSLTVSGINVGDKVTLKDKNGNAISGASPASPYTVKSDDKVMVGGSQVVGFKFIDIPAGSGYQVSVEIPEGCNSDPNICPAPNGLQSESTQAIQKIEASSGNELTAYPVPFSDKATIEFTLEKGGSYEINLYDMKGSLVRQLKAGTAEPGEVTQVEVDGRSMVEGMYFARMVTNSSKKTVKLLLKR